MEQLPAYINLFFILTTILALVLLYRATKNLRTIVIVVFWLALQAVVSLSGFYTIANGIPPRFVLLLLPPVIFIAVLFFTKTGKRSMDGYNLKALTLFHMVRIPVELTLYWLHLHKAVPEIMTFEGRNFDILCGLTAPFVYYFGFIKNVFQRKVLILWNIICLLLLANIVVTAVLSAPFRFQQFGFEQPNIALFYFPFIWLPCFIVPAALLAHLSALKQLIKTV